MQEESELWGSSIIIYRTYEGKAICWLYNNANFEVILIYTWLTKALQEGCDALKDGPWAAVYPSVVCGEPGGHPAPTCLRYMRWRWGRRMTWCWRNLSRGIPWTFFSGDPFHRGGDKADRKAAARRAVGAPLPGSRPSRRQVRECDPPGKRRHSHLL